MKYFALNVKKNRTVYIALGMFKRWNVFHNDLNLDISRALLSRAYSPDVRDKTRPFHTQINGSN